MSKLAVQSFALVTDAGGNATVLGEMSLNGARIYAVEFVLGTLTSGAVDVTLSDTSAPGGVSKTLLTLTNAAANAVYYLRLLAHGETGAALTGTAGGDRVMPLVTGRLQVVVAQGGNVLTGSLHVWYERGSL